MYPLNQPSASMAPEGVIAAADEFGDIVGAVIDALVVVSPAGRKEVIADAVAVEAHVHEAQRGGVERGAGDGLVDAELTAEEGGRREESVVELQFAPGLGSVISHHMRGRQNGGVERDGHPVVAEMVSGPP